MTTERIIDSKHNNPPSEAEIIAQKLKDDYGFETDMTASLVERELPEAVNDEAESGKLTDYINAVEKHRKEIEEIHEKVKNPFLKATQVIDTWKRDQVVGLQEAKARALKVINAYLERKEEQERNRLKAQAEKDRQAALDREKEAEVHQDAGIADTAQELRDDALRLHDKADATIQHIVEAAPRQLATARGATGNVGRTKKWVGEIQDIAIVDLNKLRPYFSQETVQKAVDAFVKAGNRDLVGVKIHETAQAKFTAKR